jgi:hypothetical protein
MTNNNFITGLYTSGMNRAPTAADLDYWGGQMANGMSQNDVRRHTMNSPEWQVKSIYGETLGRAPDQAGYDHYRALYDDIGHMGVRRDIQRQSEYQNRLLGGEPTSVGQGEARQAVAGINAMPGVFSDYTYPSMGHPQIAGNALAAQGQGAELMPGFLEMLVGAVSPKPTEADASKDGAAPKFDNPAYQGAWDSIQNTDWQGGNLKSLLGPYGQLSQIMRANPDDQALKDYSAGLPDNANIKKIRAMEEAHLANLLGSMER